MSESNIEKEFIGAAQRIYDQTGVMVTELSLEWLQQMNGESKVLQAKLVAEIKAGISAPEKPEGPPIRDFEG